MQLFFRFQKKIATTRNVFESFLTVHTNTLYRCENASKPVLAVDEGVVWTALKEVVQAALWYLFIFLDSQHG